MINKIIKKKNLIYIFAIFLGIVEKISQVLLFAVPFKAVSIVSRGEIDKLVSIPLSYLNININTNKEQFISLTVVFFMLVINLTFTRFLKSIVIKNIKIRKFMNIPFEKKNINKKKFDENLLKIEEFINIRTLLIYSSILLLFLFYYDYQITIIIILSCILNYILTKKFKSIDNANKKRYVKNNFRKNYIYKIKKNYELVTYIRPITNTIAMFCIMTSMFLREDARISIILLFIIRSALGQISALIYQTSGNKEFMKTIFRKKYQNVYNK
mgnify:CR=1 FL=1